MNSGIVIFHFFVLFNIKPYLLYWKLQRLLSLMISEFHKAHIKSFLTKYLMVLMSFFLIQRCVQHIHTIIDCL